MQKDLQAIRGKFYIHRLIDEGEHEHQDFKFKISDARKIARSISAFANNDGGRLLVGVRDNGTIAGLRSEEDMHLIDAAARIYCTPAQEVEMQAFLCEGVRWCSGWTSPGPIGARWRSRRRMARCAHISAWPTRISPPTR